MLTLREAEAGFAGPAATCPSCRATLALPNVTGTLIRSPRDVADALTLRYAGEEQELLVVLALNTKNRILSETIVYRGNVAGVNVHVGEVFRPAILANAAGLILVHNHPSGDPTPSPDDLHMTAECIAAGRLLDLDVLDHIIVGSQGWASLRDRGLSFGRQLPPATA